MFVLSNQHVQDYGVRKWAGDDLIELQSEPLSALQALVAPYASCILQGCELETIPDGNGEGRPSYRLHAGYVALKGRKTVENGADTGSDGTDTGSGVETAAATAENEATTTAEEYVKIVRVKAQPVNQPTVFLALACTPVSRAYGNGENKAIAYDYTAEVCDVLSKVGDRPYLELAADADNPRLPDTLGVTQKLNSVDGEAKDVVVTFTETVAETDSVPDRPELKSGSRLGLLMRQIRKWFDELKDLKDLAFKDKVAKGDLTDELAGELDGKVDAVDGMGLSEANFTPTEKLKLKDIKDNANNYVHPTHDSKSSGLYKITVDGSGHVSGATSVIKSDITVLGIPGQDTTYSVATTSSNGLMSSSDKRKLDGIKDNANNYVHPTHASKSSGLYKITVDSSGHVSGATTVTKSDVTALGIPGQDTTYSVVTTSSNGLMSSSDKTKLNGIAIGANNYTHPTSSGYKHIPSGGSSGKFLKYSSSGTAAWEELKIYKHIDARGGTLNVFPGNVYAVKADTTFKICAPASNELSNGNVACLNNSGWFKVSITKVADVTMVCTSNTKSAMGTNRMGLWRFTWIEPGVVYAEFIECSEYI